MKTESIEELIKRITLERNQATTHVTELQKRCTELIDEKRRQPKVLVKRVGSHTMPLPRYAHPGDSGLDLMWSGVWLQDQHLLYSETMTINSGESAILNCGFAFQIPNGYEAQLRPRSGLARQVIVSIFGTIDSGYRGEVSIILVNHSKYMFVIHKGERLAQLVIAPVARADLVEVEELEASVRGQNGFGSTGV